MSLERGRDGRVVVGTLERVPVALAATPVLPLGLQAEMEGGCMLGEGLFATLAVGFD